MKSPPIPPRSHPVRRPRLMQELARLVPEGARVTSVTLTGTVQGQPFSKDVPIGDTSTTGAGAAKATAPQGAIAVADTKLLSQRVSGCFLHPTSLPGKWGIGNIGAPAHQFVQWLQAAGQNRWVMCPLGPTGYGDSPFASFSSFAGNPYLIDLSDLKGHGLLTDAELIPDPAFEDRWVNYGAVYHFSGVRLQTAAQRFFEAGPTHPLHTDFEAFCGDAPWLEHYVQFRAVKTSFGEAPWWEWDDRDLRLCAPDALARKCQEPAVANNVRAHKFVQFIFFRQWAELKKAANDAGIQLVGNRPFYPAHDSADVWANQSLFKLDGEGRKTCRAGVPADYFSPKGQDWGNPVYDIDAHCNSNYAYIVDTFRWQGKLYDQFILDHFRGMESYWEIPASAENALGGSWKPGFGADLFIALAKALGPLPIIAEDLGDITPAVVALRKKLGFPGMHPMQFGFYNSNTTYRPHAWGPDSVGFPGGTHDNNTNVEWLMQPLQDGKSDKALAEWAGAHLARLPRMARYVRLLEKWVRQSPSEDIERSRRGERDARMHALDYVRAEHPGDYNRSALATAYASPAPLVVFTMADRLNFGPGGTLNRPGQTSGRNWQTRFVPGDLTTEVARATREMALTYGRGGDALPSSA